MHHFFNTHRSACLSIFILLIFLMGCASTPYRIHPEFEDRVNRIGKPVLMPPDVNIFELSSGGMGFFRDDWSRTARQNLQNAILNRFDDTRFRAKPLLADEETRQELEEIYSLFKLVSKSIRLHSYGESRTPRANAGKFDYSIGSLEKILSKLEADAMIFACGWSEVSKDHSRSVVNLAVADATGKIIWFSIEAGEDRYDLRDPESTAHLVKDLLSTFCRVTG